jgi:iron complex outermembrane receptor protein
MKRLLLISLFLFELTASVYAQTLTDTIVKLKEIPINIYPSKPILLSSAGSVSMLSEKQLGNHTTTSLLPAMNTLAGVRMEERSPASYRLSVRGSLLRSPFGIRNLKIYMDDFIITDAGGNTYLNLIDPEAIKQVQVLKGPEGSIFGANTGGVIVLGIEEKTDSSTARMVISGGSFGTVKEHLSLSERLDKYSFTVNHSYQRSDGYRNHSFMERNYAQLLQKLKYKKGNLKVLLMGAKLRYETPGGITLAQMENDPQLARQPSGKLPGAEEQKAGIMNSTAYAGISNELLILPYLRHVITVFGSITDFKNPFITNYEFRKENTIGARTYLNLKKEFTNIRLNWNLGFECARTESNISNFTNNEGNAEAITSADELTAGQHFIFSQLNTMISNRLNIELSASLNNNTFSYRNIFPTDDQQWKRTELEKQLLPRLGVSYRIKKTLYWRASASKGYSPPTIAEIRPSDNNIYEKLRSEYGWNYETGFRFQSSDQRLETDIVVFRFDLKDAIVRRTNSDGAEFFTNAGGTRQQGIELQLSYNLLESRTAGFFRTISVNAAYTYYDFRFTRYSVNSNDHSGNRLTGIPEQTINAGLRNEFPYHLWLYIDHNYVSSTPLTDDNLVQAKAYNITRLKAGWKLYLKKMNIEIFAGVDNMFNTSYSLGSDLNAAGARYYNPAPMINYYGGLAINL